MTCLWCPAPARKRFCSTKCKNAYHRAARLWAEKLISEGLLTIDTLKRLDGAYTETER